MTDYRPPPRILPDRARRHYWLTGAPLEIESGYSQLSMWLPATLVPARLYCQVTARVFYGRETGPRSGRLPGFLELQVRHEEAFTAPTVGRNAWQSLTDFGPDGSRFDDHPETMRRRLDRRWDRVRMLRRRPLDRRNPNPWANRGYEHSELEREVKHRLSFSGEPVSDRSCVKLTLAGVTVRVFESSRDLRRYLDHVTDPANTPPRRVTQRAMPYEGSLFDQPYNRRTEAQADFAEDSYVTKDEAVSFGTRTTITPIGGGFVERVTQAVNRHLNPCSEILLLPNCRCALPPVGTNQEESETNTMGNSTPSSIPFALAAGADIVRCKFEDGHGQKQYAYFADADHDLEKDDFVNVVSPHGGLYDKESGGFVTVVKVVEVGPATAADVQKACKWVVGKVDLNGYRDRQKLLEEVAKTDALIERAKAEAIRTMELKQLAEANPDLAKLLEQREALLSPKADDAEAKATETTTAD